MSSTKSSLDGLNRLTEGYNGENVTSIFSNPMIGKTLLLLQEAFWFAKSTGKKVLFIDTEGDKELYRNTWSKVFEKRFDVEKDCVAIKVLKSVNDLLEYHGVVIKTDISKRGSKLTSSKIDQVEFEKSKISKFINRHKVGIVIYDSITQPFIEFGTNTPNLPARSDVVGFLYNRMNKVIDKKVTVITSHHLSSNPVDRFSEEKMKGGNLIYYSSKVILQLKSFGGKKLQDYRMLMLVRYPNRAKFSDVAYLRYTDNGIFDVSEEEIQKLRSG